MLSSAAAAWDEGDERCAGDGVRRDEAVGVVELGGENVGRGPVGG